MKKSILLILILISVILICSCLFSLKMRSITEKYDSHGPKFRIHNDTLQTDALNNINSDIKNISADIDEIIKNKQTTTNNITEIDKVIFCSCFSN